MVKKQHESSILSFSDKHSLNSRKKIFQMMKEFNGSEEEKERSLPLFLRGSSLARIFGIQSIYKKIKTLPGSIFDVGTWRGQTAVICENLRAIYEPLNFNRRIFLFDTFKGYKGFSKKDKKSNIYKNGTYSVGDEYANYLEKLLIEHEKSNAMGHNNSKHKIIIGDCIQTIPHFFLEHPNQVLSLVFIDINSFEPLNKVIDQLWERLVPGGILAFWQLTRGSIIAEGQVYFEKIQNKQSHKLIQSEFYPGLCYMIKY
ncbi:MAG: hypothetical protein CMF94_01575 [Candidatus Marinimicrobia bacterium]|nr:hypothetical protein [Candidatus Neomarinimicrobiota bacterium]